MQQGTEEIHCMVFLNGKEKAHLLSKLIDRLGFKIKKSDTQENILLLSHTIPTTGYLFPGNEHDKNVYSELLESLKNQTSQFSCMILTENDFLNVLDKINKCIHRSSPKHIIQKTLDEVEKEYVLRILDMYEWKYKAAAKHLGINRSTLYRKLKKYGIEKAE